MAVKIIVPSVSGESLANEVFEIGDYMILGERACLILDSQSGPGVDKHTFIVDSEVLPSPGEPLRVAKNYGIIPLATKNVPGLTQTRGQTYMETANTAETPAGQTHWFISDWNSFEAANVYNVGDWVKINGVEYLIQTVATGAGGIQITTAPPAPSGQVSSRVYLQTEEAIIPMATNETPGVVPALTKMHELRQFEMYLPGKFAVQATTTALKDIAHDFARWGIESARIERVHYRCFAQDSGASNARLKVTVTSAADVTVTLSYA